MKPLFQDIVRHFEFDGKFKSADPYGVGHINDTYIANFQVDSYTRRYILQRINHNVFTHPEGVMSNIKAVTDHLKKKIEAAGGDPQRETLTLIPTLDGDCYIKTEAGDYWRAYIFINNAQTYEVVNNLDHVYNAAKAFGVFQKQLSDFQSDQLFETIPNFHNTRKRFEAFLEAVETDELNLVESCEAEIGFVMQRVAQTSQLVDMLERGELPERITHNDTKFNNVMIDNETGEGVCVIDLDTVMPGLSLYDFGDSIRSLANPAAEDEQDLSKVLFDMEIFEFFTRGYLDAAGEILTPSEIEQLPFSAILMTLECGMRFLTDHLQGDIYYKTHRENHNLDRCRTQFKMVQDMDEQYDDMARIVERYR
jgi:Ser/Thr protein kinase RdoA (MazF antagonist)